MILGGQSVQAEAEKARKQIVIQIKLKADANEQ